MKNFIKTKERFYNGLQIRKIDQELKAYNGILPSIIPAVLLFAGITLLLYVRKHFDVPHGWILAGLVVLLVVLFVLWEIREYRKNRCFVADFYSVQLPSMLRKAYAAYDPRIE